MPPDSLPAILAVNAGSSSLKLTILGADDALTRYAAAIVEQVGRTSSAVRVGFPAAPDAEPAPAPDFDAALTLALDRIQAQLSFDLVAVGHRIVHGGLTHTEPEPITTSLLDDLRALEPIDPSHLPQALSLVGAVARRHPSARQFACFDTAFHRTMPAVARQYPLPRRTWAGGIRRYGFHGLSCESIMNQLCAIDAAEASGRVLIAHLGNGASITAVRRGASVETTMGFSPTGGLMMGTRSGDLDPSVILYLARTTGERSASLEHLVTEESGLLGVSGLSADMRELLARTDSADAREAVDLYCYTARKHAAALVAALNGVDTIVFTGGIGEHAPAIRAGICAGLEHLGVALASEANAANEPIISRPTSRVMVRVMHADEDLVIARHVRRLLG